MRVVLGDARISLAHEGAGTFDLLVLDAFTSDAIPVHLLTREAIELDFNLLAPHGVLVANISNQYIRTDRMMAALAADRGCPMYVRYDTRLSPELRKHGKLASIWAVLARDEGDLETIVRPSRDQTSEWRKLGREDTGGLAPWTDDTSNLYEALER